MYSASEYYYRNEIVSFCNFSPATDRKKRRRRNSYVLAQIHWNDDNVRSGLNRSLLAIAHTPRNDPEGTASSCSHSSCLSCVCVCFELQTFCETQWNNMHIKNDAQRIILYANVGQRNCFRWMEEAQQTSETEMVVGQCVLLRCTVY